MRISFLILLVNALLFTQIVSAVDDDTKLKSALLKALKTHDTATVTALANGGHEAIDRDDVLQEKIYEYLEAERQRDIKAKEDAKAAAIAKQEAKEKARLDAIAAQEAAEKKKQADAIAKEKAEAAAAAAAVAAQKAAQDKKKQDAIAAQKAAEEKKKQDAIAAKKAADEKAKAAAAAKQKADAETAAAAVAAKKAADAKAKEAAQKQAQTKTVAPKKAAVPATPAPAVAAPKVKAVPKAVVAAPVIAAPIVADNEDDDEEEMTDEVKNEDAAAPEPITISDKKLIGTWKQISSEKVITLDVEENRNFVLEQIEDDGTLTITGTWKSEENIFMMSIKKVQRNVHTRETDIHRLYKVERLSAHRLVLLDKRNRIAYDLKR